MGFSRHDEDLREPLVWRQGSQVSRRVARAAPSPGSAHLLQQWQNPGPLGHTAGVLAWPEGPEKGVLWVHGSVMNT